MADVPVKESQLCPFCGNLAEYRYREVLGVTDVYTCEHCPFNVEIHKYDGIDGITMTVPLQGKYYAIDLWRPDGNCTVSLVTKEGSWLGIVKELGFDPVAWTPTNIEAKLKTLLTFL